jgi:acyl-CoA synthetase (AMP-forming)/AMP-acid ligase II
VYTFLSDGESDEVRLTYGDLDRRARAIAAFLQNIEATGDRILLLFPPGLDYISAFFGCLYAGAVAVPAYPPRVNAHLQRLQAIATSAQATIALTSPPVLSRLAPALAESAVLNLLGWHTLDEISFERADRWRKPSVDADGLAFLQYTSGSTSTPKGVMVSHGNLLHNQRLIQQAFRQTEQSVIVSWRSTMTWG